MFKGYDFYIDKLLLPITPGKIETKIGSKNKTITLINGEEMNLLKKPKLTEFEFEFRLPSEPFPGVKAFVRPQEVLNHLETLKKENKIFQFIIIRTPYSENLNNSMNKSVTLESYTINEDFKNGTDLIVEIKLKQHLPLKAEVVMAKLGENGIVAVKENQKKLQVPRMSTQEIQRRMR